MNRIINNFKHAYAQLDGIFTDKEAWALFRTAAFLETFGWVALITGIIIDRNKLPGDTWVLAVAGSAHGLFYIFYVLIVLFGHRAMKWNVKEFIIAEVVSNVPFGAFGFELYAAHKRKLRKSIS